MTRKIVLLLLELLAFAYLACIGIPHLMSAKSDLYCGLGVVLVFVIIASSIVMLVSIIKGDGK